MISWSTWILNQVVGSVVVAIGRPAAEATLMVTSVVATLPVTVVAGIAVVPFAVVNWNCPDKLDFPEAG